MRRFRSILVTLITFPSSIACAQTQAPTPAAAWAADSAAIAAASRAWMRALEEGDRPALESLMAPEFHLDTPGKEGDALPREEWLTNAFTIIETDSANYLMLRVRSLGPDLAVRNGQLFWKARLKGIPIPARHNFTDVWVRREGRWQVAARDADFADGSLTMVVFGVGLVLGALGCALIVGGRWLWRRFGGKGTVPTV